MMVRIQTIREDSVGRYVKALGLVALACALASCATSSIETNKDPASLKIIEKVYVIVNVGDVKMLRGKDSKLKDDSVAGCLQQAIEEACGAQSVEQKTVRIGGLELGENDIKKDIEDYGATVVMTVELTDGTVTGGWTGDVLHSGNIVVSIIDTQLDNKTVWKAKLGLQSYSNWGIPESTLRGLIGKLFAAMTTDGLLKPAVVTGT